MTYKGIFVAGGTAGHIYPALSIAKEFTNRHSNTELLFVGSKRGLENTIVPQAGYNLSTLDITSFPRKISAEQIKTAVRAVRALFGARRLIKEFKPDFVVGTGGYASGPMLIAAALMNYPTLIHEQNAFPSLTNRILSPFVDKIAVSHEFAMRYFPNEKVCLTGNPLRPEILKTDQRIARSRLQCGDDEKILVVVGGSGGALRLNEVVSLAVPVILGAGIKVFFVTGPKYFVSVREKIGEMPSLLNLISYAENMPDLLAAADLVVSRSGSITSELAMLAKPSILIPSPIAANNHQYYNAKVASDRGSAIYISEEQLSSDLLAETVLNLFSQPQLLQKMSDQAITLAFPRAATDICDMVEQIIRATGK
ncbi:MAG: undecaprenyldiphospho-muramoylpentapeptide beta-N-acetylglucosaminyltransferase [bacterium]|nr:undecaprenyldiphospho-muramoylpentapeptide beta-N-acetylglucosaminyltransferase [bacterium]